MISTIPIQLIGIAIGLAAIHLTYLYYKRANFTKKELYFWLLIWSAFVFISIFPRSVQPIVGVLGLQRPMDLIMIIAFIILFALSFHGYVISRKLEKKLNRLVQEIALKDLSKNEENK